MADAVLREPAAPAGLPDSPGTHKVVIVGGGFGGLAAAQAIVRRKTADRSIHVTLIDRNNHNLFQPLLYQVATAALGSNDIALPIRAVFRNRRGVEIMMADVTGIDRGRRMVELAGLAPVAYDTLVLATGSIYSWFGHDDWVARAPALKTLDDALGLRNRLLDAFERAELCDDPAETRRLLTFVVVGAGPTGVEMAGAIAELAHTTLDRDFRRIRPSTSRIVLCDAGPHVLAAFPRRLSDYAARRLQSLGIELRLGAGVEAIDAGGVTAGGERIEAECVFWAAGTEATPVAKWLGVEAGHHGLVAVQPDCSLPGDPAIFVIGDAASLAGPDGRPLPGLGAVAKQQGTYVGRLIAERLRTAGGRGSAAPAKPFRYRNWGQLAMVGGSSAVADFGWLRLTGFAAWLVWSAVHLMLLVSARSRVVVYVNWVWAWLTYSRGARVITRLPPSDRPGARA
ncbi:NAD(P)/FAD-dependent oxidoreductase [Lichenicola sp.]|uniref:NAD(P)/FAD-dependent oxidoreductase n=1 Tax=Lichenicola sp. TaxID=2804529 RepID=UPI003B0087C4